VVDFNTTASRGHVSSHCIFQDPCNFTVKVFAVSDACKWIVNWPFTVIRSIRSVEFVLS
jgi:hypothetical protein